MKTLVALLLLTACRLAASAVSYTGNLDSTDPNDFVLFEFTLTSNANTNIQTWSYDGGTNAAGVVISPGGFDPYVSLFAGTGDSAAFLLSDDDGLCPVGGRAVACDDSTLHLMNLPGGTYTLALTTFGNVPFAENLGSGTLADGFISLGSYYDAVTNSNRTSAYAIDIQSAALTPEPASFLLFLSGVLLLIFALSRRSTPVRTSSSTLISN